MRRFIRWTTKLERRIIHALENAPPGTAGATIAALATRVGEPINYNNVKHHFIVRGLGQLGAYCGKYTAHKVDPVAASVQRDQVDALRHSVKDLTERLRDALARNEYMAKLEAGRAPPIIRPREKTSGLREFSFVALGSDWHVEETVEAASVAGVNEYNLEVADKRIGRFFDSIVWNAEHDRADKRVVIRDGTIWLGGDLITGYIHPELEEANALSPILATAWLLPRLRNGLATVLERLKLESLTVVCSHGNHGRTTVKRRVSTGYANNLEHGLYLTLAREFAADKRLRFEVTPSNHQYAVVYDRVLHFHHGDEVKYQGGVGGIGIPLLKRVPQWDRIRRAHVHNIGHWHQWVDFGRVVVNGSLIGYNAFAQSIGASYEPPQQAMYYIDSKRGKCKPLALWVEDHREVEAA